jgi:uncharacterized membrane protein YqjE
MLETREDTDSGGAHRSAPHARLLGKSLERVSERFQSLTEDITEWVDLKIQLAQLEIEERIESRIRGIIMEVVVIALAGITGLFALTTLAFALGAWLGHPAWGFLIVTVLLATSTLIVRSVNRRRKRGSAEIDVTAASLDTDGRRPSTTPSLVGPPTDRPNPKAPTFNGQESLKERS